MQEVSLGDVHVYLAAAFFEEDCFQRMVVGIAFIGDEGTDVQFLLSGRLARKRVAFFQRAEVR